MLPPKSRKGPSAFDLDAPLPAAILAELRTAKGAPAPQP